MLLYKEKYKKLFPFALMFEKKKREILYFSDVVSSLLKHKKSFKSGDRKFNFPKKLFKSGFFLLFELRKARKFHFLKYKKVH